jgi:hypothetical protein
MRLAIQIERTDVGGAPVALSCALASGLIAQARRAVRVVGYLKHAPPPSSP